MPSYVVTEATGARITPANGGNSLVCDASGPYGYSAEGARSNLCLYGRDIAAGVTATGNWALTNCTAATTATGMDGAANVATTLTATGANGTCLQPFTIASAVKTYSVGIKRKTGTGKVYITLDNDSTRTEVTSLINASTYTIVQATQTLANPTIGIKIETSGDALYVDYNQLEAASFASSPIATVASPVTRAADVLTYPSASNIDGTRGTAYAEVTGVGLAADMRIIGTDDGANTSTPLAIGSSSLRLNDGANRNSGSFTASDALQKLAFTWAGAASKGYVGGVAGTGVGFDGDLNCGTTMTLGGSQTSSAYRSFGTIRRVRLYPRALSDAQVASIGT